MGIPIRATVAYNRVMSRGYSSDILFYIQFEHSVAGRFQLCLQCIYVLNYQNLIQERLIDVVI